MSAGPAVGTLCGHMNATSTGFAAAKGPQGSRASTLLVLCVAAGTAAARPDLYNNGPFVSSPGGGAGGADLSAVQTVHLNNSYGASNQQSPAADRVADNFVLAAASTVTSVVVYGFQTNASTTASPFASVNLRIWTGRPDDPGSEVIFGDTTTNRLVSAAWTGCYRARDSAPTNTQRPIYSIEASVQPPLALGAGTYWLDWQVGGTLSSGPFAALVTIAGQQGAPNANARWKDGSASNWITVVDSGNFAPQELSFVIRGTTGGGPAPCYANCDGSSLTPVLSANDFQCFLDRYAGGLTTANCDGSTNLPLLNANDFQCFLNRYAAGCS